MLILRDKNSWDKNTIERLWKHCGRKKLRETEKRKRGYDDDARKGEQELERRAQVVHTWCTVVQEVRFLFIHVARCSPVLLLDPARTFLYNDLPRIQSLYLTHTRCLFATDKLSNVKFYVHVYVTGTEGG